MHCPVCKTISLVMSERNGIEIDYCSQCRGVWLDRGELDKIIERQSSTNSERPPSTVNMPVEQPRQQPYYQQQPHHHQPSSPPHSSYYKHKKQKSFLSELFDFD